MGEFCDCCSPYRSCPAGLPEISNVQLIAVTTSLRCIPARGTRPWCDGKGVKSQLVRITKNDVGKHCVWNTSDFICLAASLIPPPCSPAMPEKKMFILRTKQPCPHFVFYFITWSLFCAILLLHSAGRGILSSPVLYSWKFLNLSFSLTFRIHRHVPTPLGGTAVLRAALLDASLCYPVPAHSCTFPNSPSPVASCSYHLLLTPSGWCLALW